MGKQAYPYLSQIEHQPTRESLRLIWDLLHSLRSDSEANAETLAVHEGSLASLTTNLGVVQRQAKQASLAVGQPISVGASFGGATSGAGGNQGGTDDGFGAQGCATAGADGHVAPGSPLTAVTVGQIICGTGFEYESLKAAAVDQPTRDTNQLELLLRIIWHLNLAGFTAGRQINPSGAISGDKITVQVDGTFRAYDVFQGVSFDTYMPTHVIQVFPADYLAEAGTPD